MKCLNCTAPAAKGPCPICLQIDSNQRSCFCTQECFVAHYEAHKEFHKELCVKSVIRSTIFGTDVNLSLLASTFNMSAWYRDQVEVFRAARAAAERAVELSGDAIDTLPQQELQSIDEPLPGDSSVVEPTVVAAEPTVVVESVTITIHEVEEPVQESTNQPIVQPVEEPVEQPLDLQQIAKESLETNIYYVDKLLERKYKKRKAMYFVSWLGFDESHNSWEPENKLPKTEVQLFKDQLKQSKAQAKALHM